MCILSVYALLKVVAYYDFSILSMSLMCFQESLYGGWGKLNPILFGFFEFFLTLQSPLVLYDFPNFPSIQ